MLGVVQQPVGREFGSITRLVKQCWRLGNGSCCGCHDAPWLALRLCLLTASVPHNTPRSSPPLHSRSLLKLIFDVPLAQAYLMEEHEAYSVPNSEDEQWAAFPRW